MTYQIKIELLSDVLPGSGEGYGAVIDTDVVFDDVGIPYIPARRVKGCLREAANDVCGLMESAYKEKFPFSLDEKVKNDQFEIVNKLFGLPGRETSAPILFNDFFIREYKENAAALHYFEANYPAVISSEKVRQTFTYIRQQTAIDENSGTADEHSLRTIRVLKKRLPFMGGERMTFFGDIELNSEQFTSSHVQLLALACLQLRYMGTKRTRGFGHVKCRLMEGGKEITVNEEELCTG